jgi:predicted MPP superfamily phosphohydrolase
MKLSGFIKGALLAGGAVLAARGLDDRLETTHYIIESDKIPSAFDGFRIVQISDVHASVIPGLVDEIRSESPDIIVSTGDLVHDIGSYEPAIRLMKRLLKLAPVFAVTGNHDLRRCDYQKFQSALDQTGVRTLRNESIKLCLNDDEILLSGIDDPFSEDGNKIENTVKNSVSKLSKENKYHIVLFHRANHMNLLKNNSFDLVLSGHMHGGQIRLPNGRGVCAPRSSWGSGSPLFFPKYFAGHYTDSEMNMIVNRGIGNLMIIPRLFNRPEITVIILKANQPQ